MVEKAAYIGLDDVIHTPLLDGAPQVVEAVVRAPAGTVAVAAIFERRLENGFQHAFRGQFHYLVFEAADPQRAALLTARLRNVTPSLRLRAVSHPLQAGGQIG
jgi:hypothetical protein